MDRVRSGSGRPVYAEQGCFKIGVLRTPDREAAVSSGPPSAMPPYRDAPPRAAVDRGLPGPDLQADAAKTLKQPCGAGR